MTDPHGQVLTWGGCMEQMLGYSASEMEGRSLPLSLFEPTQLRRRAEAASQPPGLGVLLVRPEQFERRRRRQVDLGDLDRRGQAAASNGPPMCDWTLLHRDGREVVASVTVWPLRGERGDLRGYAAVCVDVTEDRRTHSLLVQALIKEREAAHRLAELDRERDDFVATASHELRTPVASILGYAELLQDLGPELDPTVRTFVSAIMRNAARLRNLSDDLLLLARSDGGYFGERRETDLVAVVSGVWEAAVALAADGSLDLDHDLSETPVMVRGERHRLERVVLNLVGNAIKFTPEGGRVRCTVAASGAEALIRVSDTGVGVSAEDRGQLFSRFFRGRAARDGGIQGTGLGLSIVRAIVDEHDGEIDFESEPGVGTTVTVRLPALVPEQLAT